MSGPSTSSRVARASSRSTRWRARAAMTRRGTWASSTRGTGSTSRSRGQRASRSWPRPAPPGGRLSDAGADAAGGCHVPPGRDIELAARRPRSRGDRRCWRRQSRGPDARSGLRQAPLSSRARCPTTAAIPAARLTSSGDGSRGRWSQASASAAPATSPPGPSRRSWRRRWAARPRSAAHRAPASSSARRSAPRFCRRSWSGAAAARG